ncbi:unnamed protein product, partial [Laminaria digitata]
GNPAGNGGAVIAEGATVGTVSIKVEGGGQQQQQQGDVERLAAGVGVDSVATSDSSAVATAGAGAGARLSLPEAGAPEGPRRKTAHAADKRPNTAEDVADRLSLAGVTLATAPQGDVRRR